MGDGKLGTKKGGEPDDPPSASIMALSGTSCSFCWFVIMVYPAMNGLGERDFTTFKAHLVKAHGLHGEIER
jgi:hypothetical protein